MKNAVFFICLILASPSWARWEDEQFYSQSGSKYKLSDAEMEEMRSVARERVYSRFYAGYSVGSGTEPASSFLLPYDNEFGNDYGIWESTLSVTPGKWEDGLYVETSRIENEYSTQKDLTVTYGDPGAGCQVLSWEYFNQNCSTPGDGVHHVSTMPIEDMSGRKIKTDWIKCGDEWKIATRYYYGCYYQSAYYPVATVSTGPYTYASPAQYSEIKETRALLAAAISSATNSGLVSQGADIQQWITIYQYLSEGVPVASSATIAGTGSSGSTASSTTVNISFPDYNFEFDTSGEWDTFNSTSPDSPILRDAFDYAMSQSSAIFTPLMSFAEGFKVEQEAYDPCASSGCFTNHGQTLACFAIENFLHYGTMVAFLKWLVKWGGALTALFIVLG